MQKLPIFQIDAFSGELFGGNPAAVVLLDSWLTDGQMQAIAAENNLKESAFVVQKGDFVSRYFAPSFGIPEEPVTGSIHCGLIPYWAERLGKRRFVAHQLSARGGVLQCELRGERVAIGGRAVEFLEGHSDLPR